uniref:Uncharacterized protein n=1 Tax=Ditylenchus dipsaci TaxID=166011 RepID=A0A915D9G3_9BILA
MLVEHLCKCKPVCCYCPSTCWTQPSIANLKVETVETAASTFAPGSDESFVDKIQSIGSIVSEFMNISPDKIVEKPVIVLALVAVSCGAIVGMIMNPALIGKLWPVVSMCTKVVASLIVELKHDWSPQQKQAVLAITAE